jgi:hypothetical protein
MGPLRGRVPKPQPQPADPMPACILGGTHSGASSRSQQGVIAQASEGGRELTGGPFHNAPPLSPMLKAWADSSCDAAAAAVAGWSVYAVYGITSCSTKCKELVTGHMLHVAAARQPYAAVPASDTGWGG